jgi:ornithine carbamoyltransferase
MTKKHTNRTSVPAPSAMAATSGAHLVLLTRVHSSSLRQQVTLPARASRPIAAASCAVARRGVATAAASSPAVAASSGKDG